MNKNLGLVLATLVVGACGGGAGAVDSFLQQSAKEQCAWEYRCCTDAEILTTDGKKYSNEAECYPYKYLALVDQLYLERLAANEGRIRVDGAKADACIKQYADKACNPAPGTTPPTVDPNAKDPCATVLVGATGIGGDCIYKDECVTGAHCVSDASTVGRGVCVPYQQANDICNDDSDCDPSVDNLYCAQKDFKCHILGQLGDACAFSYPSATSGSPQLPMLLACDTTKFLYCDPTVNTCLSLPGDGQDCLDPAPPGVGAVCSTDPRLSLVCSTSGNNSTCRAPGSVGDSCAQRACKTGLLCDATRTCTEAPNLGDPCPNDTCRKPYFCNFNLQPASCDQPSSFGQACDVTPCDTGLYCDQSVQTCKYLLSDGAACTSSSQCISLSCQFDSASSHDICQPSVVAGVQCIGR